MLKIVERESNHTKDLQRIFLNGRQKTFYWLDTTNFALDDFEKQTQGEVILVAIFDKKIVGFISLWLPDNFIHHLYIDENYQNKNIGTRLLETAIKKMRFPITLKCLALNTRAISFYMKKGFIQKEKGDSEEGEYFLFELVL